MSSVFNPAKFLILGFKDSYPPADFIDLIKSYNPGGFIFLGNNYENIEQFTQLSRELRTVSPDSFIYSVDQEPGRVQRFKNGFPVSLMPREYAINNSYDEFRSWCRDTAKLLKEIGVNLNLAPLVDLMKLDTDFHVLKDRTFGDDPEIINRFSDILIDEHNKNNVLTCVKHFPGLGQGDSDPHEGITTSRLSVSELREYHWKPFRHAIKKNVNCIMTTHLMNSNVDNENISTFSSKIIEMIRSEMGFKGLILSDDLLMGGAGENKEIGSIAIRALNAGHNMIMISGELGLQRQAIYAIKDRYEKDARFKAVVEKNGSKIEEFKKQSGKYL